MKNTECDVITNREWVNSIYALTSALCMKEENLVGDLNWVSCKSESEYNLCSLQQCPMQNRHLNASTCIVWWNLHTVFTEEVCSIPWKESLRLRMASQHRVSDAIRPLCLFLSTQPHNHDFERLYQQSTARFRFYSRRFSCLCV